MAIAVGKHTHYDWAVVCCGMGTLGLRSLERSHQLSLPPMPAGVQFPAMR